MLVNYLQEIYACRREESSSIDASHQSIIYPLSNIVVVAIIPPTIFYYSVTQFPWNDSLGRLVYLTEQDATRFAVTLYFGLIITVLMFSAVIYKFAFAVNASTTFTKSVDFAAYTSAPLLLSALSAVYPEIWFIMSVTLLSLIYSAYLLYAGTPTLMRLYGSAGYDYACSVAIWGVILLVTFITLFVFLWSSRFSLL